MTQTRPGLKQVLQSLQNLHCSLTTDVTTNATIMSLYCFFVVVFKQWAENTSFLQANNNISNSDNDKEVCVWLLNYATINNPWFLGWNVNFIKGQIRTPTVFTFAYNTPITIPWNQLSLLRHVPQRRDLRTVRSPDLQFPMAAVTLLTLRCQKRRNEWDTSALQNAVLMGEAFKNLHNSWYNLHPNVTTYWLVQYVSVHPSIHQLFNALIPGQVHGGAGTYTRMH